MTKTKSRLKRAETKAMLREDEDFLRPLMRAALQEVLEGEMSQARGASKGERRAERLGYRSGYYSRNLVTRVGTLELRVPQDREGRFSTEVFARYQRSEKALVSALVEMYVQGVSTRKIKAVSEELCGHEFSASVVSELNKKLDEELARFASRRLEEEYPYVILDARYERVREAGVVRSRAVVILGISPIFQSRLRSRVFRATVRLSRARVRQYSIRRRRNYCRHPTLPVEYPSEALGGLIGAQRGIRS